MKTELAASIAGISLFAQISFTNISLLNGLSVVPLASAESTQGQAYTASNPESIFRPVKFSLDLIKPAAFDTDSRPRTVGINLSGDHQWYLLMKQGQSDFTFTCRTGIEYPVKTNTKLTFVDAATGVAVEIGRASCR